MQPKSKISMSKRVFAVILAILLALSSLTVYLVLERPSVSPYTGVLGYDFVLSQKGENYLLTDVTNGSTTNMHENASAAINIALSKGNSVYVENGTYVLNQDILVADKIDAKITGDYATIIGNAHRIIIYGDNYTDSQYATVSGFIITNGTIRVENSFGTTISDMTFENTSTAIEMANTRSWSEDTQIDNCHFINATEGIAFRTPTGTATGSYESSTINSCFFNINDNSVGINVEQSAEFSDSEVQNVRMWMGQDGFTNQTGILVNGAMDQTILSAVVFESFAAIPKNMFAIELGQTCNPAPLLDSGVNFLGNWTTDIHNPYSKWVYGTGSAFETTGINVPIGLNGQYGATVSIKELPSLSTRPNPK